MPQKIDLDQPQPAIDNPINGGPTQSSGMPANQRGRNSTQNSSMDSSGPKDSSGSKVEPVNPPNAVQSNLTWDPASGNWQSGGFKATYPSKE